MTKRHHQPVGTTFTGLLAIELMVALAIFIGAIIAVRVNAITLQDLQEFFG